jgi:hypothetical protein
MAEDPPQVEPRDDPPQQPVERRDESAHLSERGKGLDAMGVPPPVPAWLLPGATQPQASAQNGAPVGDGATPQASVGGDGASPQASAQDAAPPDYDG